MFINITFSFLLIDNSCVIIYCNSLPPVLIVLKCINIIFINLEKVIKSYYCLEK